MNGDGILTSKEVMEKFGRVESELAVHTTVLRELKSNMTTRFDRLDRYMEAQVRREDETRRRLEKLERRIAYIAGAGAILIPLFSWAFKVLI